MAQRILALVVLACSACTVDTAIILTVDGDLVPGADFDSLDLALWREGAQVWDRTHDLDFGDAPPLQFRIAPTGAEDAFVELTVEANLDGRALLEVRREASFVRGEEVPVRLCLWRSCAAEGGEGCAEGRCDGRAADGDADVDADADGGGTLDGGPDGADGSDAGGELCTDTCHLFADNLCEDGGEFASFALCDYGTDCTDCGPRDPATCIPRDCARRQCGGDGCGGTCGAGCAEDERCMPGGQCVRFVAVDPRRFTMGSPGGEVGRAPDEMAHLVTLNHDFEIMAVEVTLDWYEVTLLSNPSPHETCGGSCPVAGATWTNAAAFTSIISTVMGLYPCYDCSASAGESCVQVDDHIYDCEGYRLPTEAEWEYAARGRTETATYNGNLDPAALECESPNAVLDPIALFCGNSVGMGPQPVGLLDANDFGMHDMLGNVSEWVHDWYGAYPTTDRLSDPEGPDTGPGRVLRGGGYSSAAWESRAAMRGWADTSLAFSNVGFRLARTLR